jgi:hypothetical protein
LPAHDIEQAVIGAAVRALGNRALLIGRVGVSDASADQIRALLDSAGRIAAMVEKDSSPERARALRDLVELVVIQEKKASRRPASRRTRPTRPRRHHPSSGQVPICVTRWFLPRSPRIRRAPVTAICLPGLRPRFVKQSR